MSIDLITVNKEMENYTDMDPQIVYLLNLISDEQIIDRVLENMGIDHNRMRVDKINKLRIDKANEILSNLQNLIISNNIDDDTMIKLSNEYNLYIPYHSNIRNVVFTLDSVKKHIENVEVIKNIYETYQSIIKNKRKKILLTKHINVYNSLNITINILDKFHPNYNNIISTIDKFKNNYKINAIYEIYNEKQNKIYEEHAKNIIDKRLLFHGSPVTNWFSILKNGLYINPNKVGVKINGKACGNGIYFSDNMSLSYRYCFVNSTVKSGVAILGLFEVALCEKCYKESPIFVLFNTNHYTPRYLVCVKN